ncbi:hypothetical protein G9C98_002590 [Cotesia typhae]|uniref:CHCH domain-containing protein n=1 Tax=Cotesia typhae TaxID=2053667 RepID=A0A8J5VCC0_9HYME|nr:hypothetical protein G9C98_002590 [Cotesia typhae]
MKWTEHLMKWARSPQNENKVKFIPQMPLALRNHITGKGSVHKERGCLQETSVVLACLKLNDFENNKCLKEIEAFDNCFKVHTKNTQFAKNEAHKGTLVPGVKNLKYKQVNKLLSTYPQENHRSKQ